MSRINYQARALLATGAIFMTLTSVPTLFAAPGLLPKLAAVNFKPPAGARYVLDNGLVVYMLRDNTLPVVHMSAIIRTGRLNHPKGKIGLGEMTASLLKDGGSAKYTPDDIDKTLEFLGASVESSMSSEEARADMTVLKKDLEQVLDIYADILINPAFDAQKFELRKSESLEMIRRRNDDPARQAQREAARAFYGAGHPYGWRAEMATINAISGADIRQYHTNYYKPNNIILAVSGDFTSDTEMLSKIKGKFGAWSRGETNFPVIAPVEIATGRKVYLIDKDIAQTFIVTMQRGIKRHDPLEYPLSVTNEMLGGGLSSRLASEIRSRKGLAYSVYSYFSKKQDYGFINASCGTKPETYSQALSEILRQFEAIKETTAPEEEVKRAKDSMINSFVFRFATPFDLISERALYEYYGYKSDYLDTYVDAIARVDPAAVLETSKKLFKPESALIFVIGDSKKFDKPLSTFGEVVTIKED